MECTSCRVALNTGFAVEAFVAEGRSFLLSCEVPDSTGNCCSSPGTFAAARTCPSCYLFEHTDLSARKRLDYCILMQRCSSSRSSRKCLVSPVSCLTACLATGLFA